jgi:hypothetical protein
MFAPIPDIFATSTPRVVIIENVYHHLLKEISMKLAGYLRFSLFFVVALTVLFLSSCDNTVNVSVADNGKVVLHPNYQDRIIWQNVKVHFLIPAFCVEQDKWLSTCTVNVKVVKPDFGQYNYVCESGKCADPEVDVGASNGQLDKDRLAKEMLSTLATVSGDYTVGLPCMGTTIMPSPAALPDEFQSAPVIPGKVVLWQSQGNGGEFLKDWKITFDDGNATVCTTASIDNKPGNQVCTIKAPSKYPYKATYKATSTTCQTGSGSVTISAP